jgi:hypothetical protein
MAAGDGKPPEKIDEESPAPAKPDVRVSSHEDMGVNVSRDLRAQGPSARGWNSNMSKLNFSARALPRDESTAEEPAPAPAAAAPVETPAPAESPSAASATPADSSGPLSWLTGLFSSR